MPGILAMMNPRPAPLKNTVSHCMRERHGQHVGQYDNRIGTIPHSTHVRPNRNDLFHFRSEHLHRGESIKRRSVRHHAGHRAQLTSSNTLPNTPSASGRPSAKACARSCSRSRSRSPSGVASSSFGSVERWAPRNAEDEKKLANWEKKLSLADGSAVRSWKERAARSASYSRRRTGSERT
jgi:hypothetical protein